LQLITSKCFITAGLYIEAFFDGNLEWTEYAYTERELQNLKNDAIDCGFTFTVEEVSND